MVEGWAASYPRVGAVIGSLREVTDTSAGIYAQEFYRAAFGGCTLGPARDANRGGLTWLVYALFGGPAATVSTQPRQPG
jgi:hypothetical protein